MFKEDIKTIFPLLKELYDLDGLILVGSDVSLWKELSEQTNIEDVHYVNTQEQKQISFPNEWHTHEQLLAKEDGIVSYYDLSNSQLSGTVPSEVLSTLWRNLKTVDIREKKALSLEAFISNVSARKNALVVNSFDAVDIVQKNTSVEVVVAHTIDSDDESLTHYSKNALDVQMKKLGYKAVALLEDKHPQVFSAVYAVDKEKQKKELETLNAALQTKTQESEKLAQEQAALKEEKQKIAQALETEKANAVILQKEKEETAKALQNKNSEVETLKNELKTKTEALSNSLEQEKQNSTNLKKELETLNAALQTKAQESEKLAQEQAALKEEKRKVAQALETEKVNAVTLQKEKEETAKALQNKNSEVETLKNELKTKTEALTKSLEQEKQNSTNLKKELETLNAALQTKAQESEKVTQILKAERDLKQISTSSSLKEDIERVSESFEIQVSSIIKKLDKKHTKEKIFLEKIKQEKKLIRKSLKLLWEKEKSINSILSDLKQLKGKLFIDCGGYDGCSAIKFLLKNPEYDVITFEPNSEMWDYYKDIPTKLIEKAVMHYDGVVDFTIDPIDGDGSSVIKEKKIDATNKVSNGECPIRSVACVDLSAFIKKQSKKYAEIILKLDIEGAEYKVIQKVVDDGTLDFIDKIYAEFHWKKMGLEKSMHDGIVSLIQKKLVEEEWDALEFAVHKGTHKEQKIRTSLLKGLNKNG